MTELSPWRFRWRTVPAPVGEQRERTDPIVGMTAEAHRAERHGQAFRALRMECGLSLGAVARG